MKSKAIKVYICNVMTQPGETDGFGAFEHVETLTGYAGQSFLDYVIVNSEAVSEEQKALYKIKGQEPISPDSDMVRHDPQKLAQAIMSLTYRLRLFGRGFVFFDYFFMRHNMRRLSKKLGKES